MLLITGHNLHIFQSIMDWRPIQAVFLLHTQHSWDSLQIHRDPDLDKALTEDETAVMVLALPLHFSSDKLGI